MTIEKTITETRVEKVNIPTPYFCKVDTPVAYWIKVVDENNVLVVDKWGISCGSTYIYKKQIAEAEPITLLEFQEQMNKVLEEITTLHLTFKCEA